MKFRGGLAFNSSVTGSAATGLDLARGLTCCHSKWRRRDTGPPSAFRAIDFAIVQFNRPGGFFRRLDLPFQQMRRHLDSTGRSCRWPRRGSGSISPTGRLTGPAGSIARFSGGTVTSTGADASCFSNRAASVCGASGVVGEIPANTIDLGIECGKSRRRLFLPGQPVGGDHCVALVRLRLDGGDCLRLDRFVDRHNQLFRLGAPFTGGTDSVGSNRRDTISPSVTVTQHGCFVAAFACHDLRAAQLSADDCDRRPIRLLSGRLGLRRC